MCNHIHISILHHIPHVVYTSIYIIIYIFTLITSYISYLHWSPIWFSSWQAPPGQRVRQVILRGCSDIPFAGWKTGALWVGQRGYCWLYTPKLWMLFTNHWSIADGRSFSGTQGRSNNQTDRSWATDSHWWHWWPFPWCRMAFACNGNIGLINPPPHQVGRGVPSGEFLDHPLINKQLWTIKIWIWLTSIRS